MNPRLAVLLLLALAMCSAVHAESTRVWVETDLKQFGQGEPENVAIGGDGDLRLAPESKSLAELNEACVWAMAEDKNGNVYLGTGAKGTIYRIAADGSSSEFFVSTEMHILSLALDDKGVLYAGTAPHGRILRIAPGGEGVTFHDTGTAYVWALLVAADGDIIAGTGKDALILRLAPDGKVKFRHELREKHVLCLAPDAKGNTYAGTGGKGVAYKIDGKMSVTALYQAPQPEIQALVFDAQHERLYGATASGQSPTERMPVRNSRRSDKREGDLPTPPTPGENGIFRIDLKSGGVDNVIGVRGMSFYSLAWHQERLYAGSGPQGWLFLVDDDGIQAAVDRPERQVLALLAGMNGILMGTANDAAAVRLWPRYASAGAYVSRALDGGGRCRWGRIRWMASTPASTIIEISTRSGNTDEPGDTWSGWEPVQGNHVGAVIESPPARYLQYRVQLATKKQDETPIVESLHISYMPRNRAPRIKELVVRGSGNSTPRPVRPGPSKKGRPPFAPTRSTRGKGISISWKVTDPNRDTLRADLYCRSEEEAVWHKIAEDVKGARYSWDTRGVADGWYRILLRISDGPSNSSSAALVVEQQSKRVIVDGGRPVFEKIEYEFKAARRCRVRGVVRDAFSRITRIEFALDDAEDWVAIEPDDGILDHTMEEFSFTTPPLFGREHSILVRTADAAGNLVVRRLVVRPAAGR